jgi:LPXTG-site transpeptidase (sortase) family protein
MRRRLSLFILLAGLFLFSAGTGMRLYASALIGDTTDRLLAARPTSPSDAPQPINFKPANGAPTEIRLPAYDLWNTLEPVTEQINWSGSSVWQVKDAGWHVSSGWPGWGSNVVLAGHSPAMDAQVWAHSVFRQLAYLQPGDEIELTAGDQTYHYQVQRVFAIPEKEAPTANAAAWLAPNLGERLTLVTCWPPNTAANRVLVVAYPK